jgi:hypothetical protein
VLVRLLDFLFWGILATCKPETRAAETTASSLRQSSSAPPALKRPVSSFSVAARGQTRDSKNGPIARRLCRSGKIYTATNATTGKTETVRCLNFRGLLQPFEFADPAPAIFLPRDIHATFYFYQKEPGLGRFHRRPSPQVLCRRESTPSRDPQVRAPSQPRCQTPVQSIYYLACPIGALLSFVCLSFLLSSSAAEPKGEKPDAWDRDLSPGAR